MYELILYCVVAPVGQTLVPSASFGDILSPTSSNDQSSPLPVKALNLQHSRQVRSITEDHDL